MIEKDNPFQFIQPNERRQLLKILYPTIDYDLLFYPESDDDKILDELSIPNKVHVGVYVITPNKELKQFLHEQCKVWLENKEKE
jgi:hypothetical protein